MGTFMQIFVFLLAAVVGAALLAALVFLMVKLFGLVWKILTNVFVFLGAEVRDVVRVVGSVIVIPILSLFVLGTILIGRWSASGHYGRVIGGEVRSIGSCLYRLAIGNPARLLGLGGALEGVEQRLPAAMAEAPGRDKPKRGKAGQFDGYKIIGSLPGGGSGAKLYIAEPDDVKRAALARRGMEDVDRVVIKVFSREGTALNQAMREGQSLGPAKELGLVLEHSMEEDRFFYVMRYVPGDSLGVATQRLHSESPSEGLDTKRLKLVLGYVSDLVGSLETYHRGGLWHKDVKPDNIIVDANDGRAHLVDFGLVTPMRAAMTLTTHGTEYFRDPELVRQALRGVRVNEIDGAKFDVYSAGAVLYSAIENSFPAHGGLSQLTRRCPEALRWIVRRAMTDYARRYESAAAMLLDLEAVRHSDDPWAMKPIDLPSMQGGAEAEPEPPVVDPLEGFTPPVVPPSMKPRMPEGDPIGVASRGSPRPMGVSKRPAIRVSSWWSGRYEAHEADCSECGTNLSGLPTGVKHCPSCGKMIEKVGGVQQAGPLEDVQTSLKDVIGATDQLIRDAVRPSDSEGPMRGKGTPTPKPAARAAVGRSMVPVDERMSAQDQLESARARVRERRARARAGRSRRAAGVPAKRVKAGPGGAGGMLFGLFIGLAILLAGAVVGGTLLHESQKSFGPSVSVSVDSSGEAIAIAQPGQPILKWESVDAPDVDELPVLDERVLVVSDLLPPVDEDVRAELEELFAALHAAGAELSGDLVGTDSSDGAIELLATVRARRGALPLDASELPARLVETLVRAEGGLDAVLWISPLPEQSGRLQISVIGRESGELVEGFPSMRVEEVAEMIAEAGEGTL